MKRTSSPFVTFFAALAATPPWAGCSEDPAEGPADAGVEGPADAGCPALGPRPERRSEHVLALFGDELVIFGGTTAIPENCNFPAPVFSDETWRYDIRCGVFTRVEGEGPGPRARAMGAYDPVGDRVLVFGGRTRTGTSGPYTLMDDLWALDDEGWTRIEASGPGPRVAGAMGVDDQGRVWIFGGDSSTSGAGYAPLGDTWSYDPAGPGWAQAVTATAPDPRLLVAATFDQNRGRLLVFGGTNDILNPNYFADLWSLDTSGPTWTRLHDGSGTAPTGRFFPAMAWDEKGDGYWMMGGHDGTALGNRNDLWHFDAQAGQWSELGPGDGYNAPPLGFCDFPVDFADVDLQSPERRSSHGMAAGSGSLWLFGGKSDCGALDDVWSFDGTWHERTPAAEGEVCLRFFADFPKYECQGLCL